MESIVNLTCCGCRRRRTTARAERGPATRFFSEIAFRLFDKGILSCLCHGTWHSLHQECTVLPTGPCAWIMIESLSFNIAHSALSPLCVASAKKSLDNWYQLKLGRMEPHHPALQLWRKSQNHWSYCCGKDASGRKLSGPPLSWGANGIRALDRKSALYKSPTCKTFYIHVHGHGQINGGWPYHIYIYMY